MDELIQYACDHYILAQCFLAFCILLAGINIPISLDVTLISSGALASLCPFINPPLFYVFLATAAWISAMEGYWVGRLLGPKLYKIRWLRHFITEKRVERLHHYYEKFGFLTFMVGRFVPGGVRNTLFMSSGLGKMPFYKFILRDLPACWASCGLLFYLGYIFGQNYQVIVHYFKTYNIVVICTILVIGLSYCVFLYVKGRKSTDS